MLSIVTFLLFLGIASSFQCGGSKDMIQQGPNRHRKLYTRSSSFAPIRIFYYYQNFNLGTSTLNSEFADILLPAADSFFKNTLEVQSIQGNLALGFSTCGSEISIPASHQSPGVENTDVIVYLTTSGLSGAYDAYAGSCVLDPNSGIPVAGRVVISTVSYALMPFDRRLTLINHEITHILGFSSELFSYWRKSDGNLYSPSELTTTVTLRGAPKTLLITPNVVAKAQEAFACSTLIGMELEDQLNPESIGSHWEMRTMRNDFMVTNTVIDSIRSTITLALLEDSGWYQVNYEMGQIPVIGRNIGCTFFDTKCLTSGVSNYPTLFCDTNNDSTCDAMRLNKAKCNKITYTSALPSAFQYYSSNTIGGENIFADYCPIRVAYIDGSCRGNEKVTTMRTGTSEVIGMNSRCFESSLKLIPNTITSDYSACYEVKSCSSTSATVKIGTQTLECPFTGGTFTVSGYNGSIKCPASSVLCNDVPCLHACMGNGKCINGLCQCLSGHSGNDCSIKCGNNCGVCTSTSCTSCAGANMVNSGSECSCIDGYILDENGDCIDPCGDLCEVCGNLACSLCVANAYFSSNDCTCIYGYVNSGLNSCEPCSNNCVSCTSVNECSNCAIGFYLTLNSDCLACGSDCDECNSIECIDCSNGYVLFEGSCLGNCPTGTFELNGACKACSDNCNDCTSTQCNSCNSGFYPSGSNCIDCSNNCIACSSITQCTDCKIGFYLTSNSDCLQCASNCDQCNSNECTHCTNGYVLYEGNCLANCPPSTFENNGACEPCSDNCNDCTSTQCNNCDSGFYLTANSDCLECALNCAECNANECTHCANGYVLYEGSCLANCPAGTFENNGVCEVCSDNCNDCNSIQCNICDSGFYPAGVYCLACQNGCSSCISSTECLDCSDHCDECDSNGCITCANGYNLILNLCELSCPDGTFSLNGVCSNCSDNCLVCESFEKCSICNEPFDLINNFCCIENCSECESGICTLCQQGYSYSNLVCEPCDVLCESCDVSSCTSCIDNAETSGATCKCSLGFYKDSSICSKCLPNCFECENNSACTNCNSGYYLSSSNTCLKCSSSCLTCTSTECTSCRSPLVLYDGTCIRKCPTNTYELNRICTSCGNNCKKCSGNKCIACENDHTLVLGKCIKCPENCETCTSENYCTKCEENTTLIDGQCCITNCKYCSNGICHACADEFQFNNSMCCPINCFNCVDSICKVCQNGYALTSTKECSPKNCESPKRGICERCYHGYKLRNGICI